MRINFSAWVLLLIANYAVAQTKSTFTPSIPGQPNPQAVKAARPSAAPQGSSTAVAPPAAPAPKKSPVRLVYSFEYDGNNFGKSLTRNPAGEPAECAHDFKVGYAVSSSNVIGIREVVSQKLEVPEDGSPVWVSNDWKAYLTWANMIQTSDVDMSGTLDIVFPTSDASVKAQKLVSFAIKNSWTPKTELRNWGFNVVTVVAPLFFQDPTGKADLKLVAVPNITVDIGPQTHIYWELSLDAKHLNSANFFDFTQGDPDSFTLGPQFDLDSHFTAYPALKFYTGELSFKAATVYFNLTAAL